MKISSDSYEILAKQYMDAYQWLDGMGLNVKSGRLSEYLKVIKLISETYKTSTDEELKNIFPDTVNSMYEINAIINIHEAFKDLSNNDSLGLISKLKKAVSGPVEVKKESNTSNTARNYLFETLVMARLHNPNNGLSIDFKSSTDTSLKYNNVKYLIECKRPQSGKKLEANVRDAANQLQKAFKNKIGSNHKGLIAIDISKIFNPDFMLLVKANDTELHQHISLTMDAFISKYSHKWQNILKNKNKKIVGVILRISLMGVSEERNLLVSCVQWAINPKNGISNQERNNLMQMAKILEHA